MGGIALDQLGTNTDPDKLISALKKIFSDLEDQLNSRANIFVSTDGRIPSTLQKNDLLVVALNGLLSIYIKTSKNYLKLAASMLGGLSANGSNFLGFKTSTITPAVSDFPKPGDFGFFTNSTGPTFYLCANFAGTLKKVTLT